MLTLQRNKLNIDSDDDKYAFLSFHSFQNNQVDTVDDILTDGLDNPEEDITTDTDTDTSFEMEPYEPIDPSQEADMSIEDDSAEDDIFDEIDMEDIFEKISVSFVIEFVHRQRNPHCIFYLLI